MSAACVLVASAGLNSRFITMWKRLLLSSALLFLSRRMLDLAGVCALGGGGGLSSLGASLDATLASFQHLIIARKRGKYQLSSKSQSNASFLFFTDGKFVSTCCLIRAQSQTLLLCWERMRTNSPLNGFMRTRVPAATSSQLQIKLLLWCRASNASETLWKQAVSLFIGS